MEFFTSINIYITGKLKVDFTKIGQQQCDWKEIRLACSNVVLAKWNPFQPYACLQKSIQVTDLKKHKIFFQFLFIKVKHESGITPTTPFVRNLNIKNMQTFPV